MKTKRAVFLPVALLLTTLTLQAEETPNPNEVSIREIHYRGSGCLPGSASSTLSPDAKALTLLFDRYTTEAGGENSEVGQKSCHVEISLNIPPGWSYTLFAVDYRGFANLDAGAIATQNSCYMFASNPTEHFMGEQKMQGPYASSYVFRNQISMEKLGWSSCAATTDLLRIKTSIRVEGDYDRRALMTVDSMDGELKQQYAIQWKRCGGSGPELVNVYRFSKDDDGPFFFTTNPADGAHFGRDKPQTVFRVYKTQVGPSGLIPLLRCGAPQKYKEQFLSTDPHCRLSSGSNSRNYPIDGTLGFIRSDAAPGHVPLYRIFEKNLGNGRNLDEVRLKLGVYFGTSVEEARKYDFRGNPEILGYVLAAP